MKKTFLILTLFLTSLGLIAQDNSPADSSSTDTLSNEAFSTLVPTNVIDANILESETQSQDVSGLLQSSRDVYTSIAGFNFSAARFRIRGYQSEHYSVLMNGIELNDPESGWAIWANWGGLNDITRYQAVNNGISPSQLNFGGIGGSSNISTRASKIRKTTKLSYALANRSYNHRAILTYSTGLMENGWAVAFSGSVRYAKEGYVDGTFYDANSYFISVEKKLNNRHSLGLVGLTAQTTQGRQGISVQEAQELTGNNYYNPYWGYQDGEKRNSRIRKNNKPLFFFSHYFNINEKSKLTTTYFQQTGKGSNTGLNWYDGKDPRPDYYRYLPSYYKDTDEAEYNRLTAAWKDDPTRQQIDWDQLYFANSKNLYTLEDADGTAGNDITGNRAKYIVEEYHVDPSWSGLNTNYTNSVNDRLKIATGISFSSYKSKNYKEMNDLLGADFWVDVDQFAERDFEDENAAQNDLETPNKVIEQGDIFGYNYDININKAEYHFLAEYKLSKLEYYLGLNGNYTSFWRTGHWQNGRFPDNSLGESEKQTFLNYGVKGGATYKLNGRNYVTANGAYLTKPPSVRNAYVSPRTRDYLVEGLTSSKITSYDINYLVRYPRLKARATWFYTAIKDQTWSRSFYHDEFRTFVNYNMTGVDNEYSGFEFGIEGAITQTITLSAAATKANYIYTSRPTATITADNSSEVVAEDRTVYFKNFRVGGSPQTAASIGIKYSSPKYWFAGVNFNYFTDIYIDANPDRRTEDALGNYVSEDPQWSEVLDQTKLEDGYMVNLFIGKSWRINYKYFINLNLNVSNVLNNTDFVSGGFEQLRYDAADINKFPAKTGYSYGRTYFLMASFRF